MIDAASFRSQFSITDKRAYLFAGAIAPAADAVRQAAQEWIQAWAVDPLANYDAAFTDMVRVREAIGGILGVDGSRITLSENTSQASNLGIRLLARGSAGLECRRGPDHISEQSLPVAYHRQCRNQGSDWCPW